MRDYSNIRCPYCGQTLGMPDDVVFVDGNLDVIGCAFCPGIYAGENDLNAELVADYVQIFGRLEDNVP